MTSRRPGSAARLLVTLALASAAEAGVIAIDARSFGPQLPNPATTPEYAGFRGLLTESGHSLVTLTSFTAADLDGVDLLILLHPLAALAAFSGQEITDVNQFVAGGGNLWFIADAGDQTSLALPAVNAILQPHGVTVTQQTLNPSGVVIGGLVPHGATTGVQTIGLDFHRTLTATPPALDLTTGGLDVLAVVPSQGGGGRVAVITDSTFLLDPGHGADHDLTDFHNRALVLSLTEWLLPPFTGGCPGAGGFVPTLSATSYEPAAGTQLGIQLQGALGGAPATFFFGAGSAELPMAGGCTLNVAPLLPASFTVPLGGAGPGQGMTSFSGVLPAGTSGATFAMQAFVTDPTFAHGFSNSNEIVVDIQ